MWIIYGVNLSHVTWNLHIVSMFVTAEFQTLFMHDLQLCHNLYSH